MPKDNNTSSQSVKDKESSQETHDEVSKRLPKWCQVVLSLVEQQKPILKTRKK